MSSASDNALLAQPIVIIGAPRSGTTNLGRLLSLHCDLAYADEPRLIWRFGNDRKSDLLRAEDARPAVCEHIRRYFRDFVRRSGRRRLLEKTPSNALRMAFVDHVFPDARFIHVIRHGVDSVLSIRQFWRDHAGGIADRQVVGKLTQRLREMRPRQWPHYAREFVKRLLPARLAGPRVWGPRIPAIEQLARELDVLEVCCLQWRMCVEAACHYGRSLPPERYLEFHLEDLSVDVLRRIFAFCDLENDAAVFESFRNTFDPERARSRRASADLADLERIRFWIEPTLHWLGYEP